jgi:glycosyltransferase involved in cell wall biosynthesis
MRVLHVAPSRASESSAAWRIAEAQKSCGVNAGALIHKPTEKLGVEYFSPIKFLRGIDYIFTSKANALLRKLDFHQSMSMPWSYNFFRPHTQQAFERLKYDVINLHWLPSTVDLSKLFKIETPIVLTLHDVWPLTGGCHINLLCSNWRAACSHCPQNDRKVRIAPNTKNEFERKRRYFSQIKNLSVVAPSEWIGTMAKESEMFNNRSIVKINNCLSENNFGLQNRAFAQKKIGVVTKKKIVTFAVSGDIATYGKGLDLFIDVLNGLRIKEQVLVLLVGNPESVDGMKFPVEVVRLGSVQEESRMNDIYSASNVFVTTSRQENLPNTLIEAAYCGIPSISFDVGGVSEIIYHGKTGSIIQCFDITGFSKAIEFWLEEGTRIEPSKIREMAVTKFTPLKVGNLYKMHYLDMLDKQES